MKKEDAFKAMKNGAKIAHKTWISGAYIKDIDGIISDEEGTIFCSSAFDYFCDEDKWYIVAPPKLQTSYQAEQLLKAIPLHLKDPNRVWCESGHELEEVIAKEIRELHRAIMIDNEYIDTLKDQMESLKSAIIAKDEIIQTLRERMNHF